MSYLPIKLGIIIELIHSQNSINKVNTNQVPKIQSIYDPQIISRINNSKNNNVNNGRLGLGY